MKNYAVLLPVLLIFSFPMFAFQDMENVTIETIPVSENISMLKGRGGNIAILTGEDGTIMIDDQFAALSPKIMKAIKKLSDKPVRFLVNTHFHGDHTGGNSNFQKEGALIMAHKNVRKRLADEGENGLPIITFNDKAQLFLNNNDIMLVHVHNAHTDGDILIYFPQDNVLHTGDTFFNGNFPFIDLQSGGSAKGLIEATELGLSLINENTKIIPGHGNLASFTDYENYLKMLQDIQKNVLSAIDSGKTREEVSSNQKLTQDFYSDEEAKDAFINGPKIRETFYDSLLKEREQ